MRMLLNKIDGKEFLIDQTYKIKATPALYLVEERRHDRLRALRGARTRRNWPEVIAKAE